MYKSNKERKTLETYRTVPFSKCTRILVIKASWELVEEFSNITDRNKGSFGSTGS